MPQTTRSSSLVCPGNELDFLTTGRLNNVDAINIAPDRFLVAASNRTAISIDLYEADLRKDSVVLVSRVTLDVLQPYGLCMGRTPERSVFVGDTTGNVEHWVLADDLTAAAPAQRVGLYRFDSQTEGCVFDANDNTLYVGEEDRGIWAVDLASGQRRLLDSVGAGFLVADVEGLDIYQGDSQRLLVASSQGDNTYVLYRLPEGAPLAKFRIFDAPGDGIDGSEDTDGVAVTNQPLPGYPRGILVVQDGFNRKPRARQNFKGVDWRKIEALIPTH
jgi:3-phytase